MKLNVVISLAAVVGMCALPVSYAADTGMMKPGVVEARSASLTGIVESIDYKTRQVILKTPKGDLMPMDVGPEAVRFNEVKKGDTVKIDYLESVAVVVADPHDKVASAEGSGKVIVRNKTSKPSGTAIETHVATATVEKINAKKRTATLKAADGHTFDIDIAPDVQHLENVKKGDQVLVKYTQSLAIAVTKP